MSSVAPVLETNLTIEELDQPVNLDALLTEDQSDAIARQVVDDYDKDKESRKTWEKNAKQWLDLALQVKQDKTFPWPDASNVKFPLLTIAALQFAARAYPALVRPPSLVRMRVNGEDTGGDKRRRARRVAEHMSYQLLEEDESWEENHDKLLAVLPISGLAFKKSYFSAEEGHNKSELVLPHELVVNYWATSLDNATSVTHVYRRSHREVTESQRAGIYSKKDLGVSERPEATLSGLREKREPEEHSDQHTILEQHCWLDLDNDGLEEPYIVFVDKSSRKVLRIQNRFSAIMMKGDQVIRVKATQFFTKYGFLPAPDGSFYDMGFGTLLFPINESANSLINQLVDAGTMQIGSRGFIGRGARFQGGQIRFKHPYEWIRVNTSGQTLKESIVPLPVNPPSPVLFNLLGMLVEYGERISSVTDMMTGQNPGQNTPAYTSQKMLEQGMQVFTGIFKRVYRSMRDEYRKLYLLNREYLDPESYYSVHDGEDTKIFQTDYEGDTNDVSPLADPNTALREQRVSMASMILERSMAVPGYNKTEVERDWLEAIEHPNQDRIFPIDPETGQSAIPPPQDPEIEVKLAEEQRRMLEGKQRGEVSMIEAMTKAMVGEAQVMELETRARLNLAKAQEAGETTAIKLYEAQIKEIGEKRASLEALMSDSIERKKLEQPTNTGEGSS
jgi:chaperonin GroES